MRQSPHIVFQLGEKRMTEPTSRWDAFAPWELAALDEFFPQLCPAAGLQRRHPHDGRGNRRRTAPPRHRTLWPRRREAAAADELREAAPRGSTDRAPRALQDRCRLPPARARQSSQGGALFPLRARRWIVRRQAIHLHHEYSLATA